MASALLFTRTPWWDESNLADPAYNLTTAGKLASTVLQSTGHPLIREIVAYDEYTYWTTPLYLVTLAGWFKVVGFSIFRARYLSVVWGVVLLASVAAIGARLSGKSSVGFVTLALAATDYTIVVSSTNARMDSMGAALGFAGIACYLLVREHSCNVGVLMGAVGTAAAALTHPVGALHTLGLIVVVFYTDRSRLRLRTALLFALPYLVGAGLWGLYIARAPSIFLQQITATTSYRVGGVHSPFNAILSDFSQRYLFYFSAHAQTGFARLKVLVLIAFLAALGLGSLVPEVRRSPGVRLCAGLCIVYYCGLAILDYSHAPLYVIYVVPFPLLLLALILSWLWDERRLGTVPLLALGAAFALLQLGGVGLQVRKNTYAREYVPVVQFVRTHEPKGSLIMGSSELFFSLGEEYRVIDDSRLGALSHVRPDMIVAGQFYPDAAFFDSRGEHDVAQHIARMLTQEYRLIAQLGVYRIYTPVAADSPSSNQAARHTEKGDCPTSGRRGPWLAHW